MANQAFLNQGHIRLLALDRLSNLENQKPKKAAKP
jgi:hypothetical protein